MQHRLGLIVGRVARRNPTRSTLLGQPLQPLVAQSPGRGFEVLLCRDRQSRRSERQAQPFRQLAHEGFVRVALLAAQAVVGVRDDDVATDLPQRPQERDAVRAARNGRDDRPSDPTFDQDGPDGRNEPVRLHRESDGRKTGNRSSIIQDRTSAVGICGVEFG
jgi:hypothetical protein